METTIVKKNNLDFPLKYSNNSNSHSDHSPTFLFHDGFDSSEFKASDIEMITIQSLTYTSLKDLLPASPQPAIMSPTHNSSWHEIPIRNPLVKHAALAYLQPMSTPTEVGDKGLFGKLKEKCLCGGGGGFGCFGWIGDVVLAAVKVVFCGFLGGGGFENGEEEDYDDEDDEDDDDDEKVD